MLTPRRPVGSPRRFRLALELANEIPYAGLLQARRGPPVVETPAHRTTFYLSNLCSVAQPSAAVDQTLAGELITSISRRLSKEDKRISLRDSITRVLGKRIGRAHNVYFPPKPGGCGLQSEWTAIRFRKLFPSLLQSSPRSLVRKDSLTRKFCLVRFPSQGI